MCASFDNRALEPASLVYSEPDLSTGSLKDLALARPVCTFFEAYWQDKFSNNVLPLRVGIDVATIDGVMGVIEILSSRRNWTLVCNARNPPVNIRSLDMDIKKTRNDNQTKDWLTTVLSQAASISKENFLFTLSMDEKLEEQGKPIL